ncbi:helix-turn-helix domain-containing protein [Microbacterium sp. NPDC058269]|uniref:helix-turn-helix domain-containing protein n=1 Tax=Microbacterium sp. NPDC058269 TaxID=3346414 RepID=UPI0036DC2EC0
MTTSNSEHQVQWNLRAVMAAAGMFHTTDLREPLQAQGVNLSREQVFRLVTKTPDRLNMTVLAALCRIFSCTPNDLIELRAAAPSTKRRANGTAPTSGAIGTLRPVPARIHRPTDQKQ